LHAKNAIADAMTVKNVHANAARIAIARIVIAARKNCSDFSKRNVIALIRQ